MFRLSRLVIIRDLSPFIYFLCVSDICLIMADLDNRNILQCVIKDCYECCVLSGRGLRRTDHSFRGVLPTEALRCVCSINLVREEAKAR